MTGPDPVSLALNSNHVHNHRPRNCGSCLGFPQLWLYHAQVMFNLNRLVDRHLYSHITLRTPIMKTIPSQTKCGQNLLRLNILAWHSPDYVNVPFNRRPVYSMCIFKVQTNSISPNGQQYSVEENCEVGRWLYIEQMTGIMQRRGQRNWRLIGGPTSWASCSSSSGQFFSNRDEGFEFEIGNFI